MLAGDVLRLVSGALQDLEAGTDKRWAWSGGQNDRVGLLDFLNAGLRTIAMLRPDATAKTMPLKLQAGERQSLPADALMLLEITRNMGPDGNTPGESVFPVAPEVLRGLSCNGLDTGSSIENYACDRAVTSQHFDVFPAVKVGANVWVLAAYSATPPVITSSSQTIPLPDTFQSALVHAVLYGVFSGDSEGSNGARMAHHYQSMLQELDLKQTVDTAWPVNAPQVRGSRAS